ncbi:unnamed protein product [Sympodiomycopsis kandeliae]
MSADSISPALDMLIDPDQHPGSSSSSSSFTADELTRFKASLEQYVPSSTDGDQNNYEVDDSSSLSENEGISALGPSLWQQLLAEANEWQEPEQEEQPVHQDPSIAALDAHLSSLDPGLATSLRVSITDLLADPHKNDDLAAAELAELLGFEQLDLVGEILSNRKQVTKALQQQTQHDHQQQEIVPTTLPASSLPPTQSHQMTPTAKPYLPGAQMSFRSAQEIAESKSLRAANRKAQKAKQPVNGANPQLSLQELEQLRHQQLRDNAHRPLFSSERTVTDQPKYPHVFSSGPSGNVLSVFGSKFALPSGTLRNDYKEYEEVTIPPPKAIPMRSEERLIPINEMDTMCRGAFPGYKSLNRLQSVVYPLGYGSNENLLVCAPTGAGKTDVAMLTVLRAISQYTANLHAQGGRGYGIKLNDFKIIYVAPMKALAAEIVRKFSKRLAYLGVKVRELTGDMQMTRQEIADTQMIVTTPEKWDVVTRKPTGEGQLATKVKLLIIDEVHLLHEDRGAVIETIVARTLRLVESSQSLIRIVGLSATLPNYVDVADFLRVNRYQGLFYFDSSFRPVPLEQHFLGIKGKHNSPQARTNLDKAVFYKAEQLLKDGHQVMIFVHARKETVKSALSIREMCRAEGVEDLLLQAREENEGLVNQFKRDMSTSRNKELKELFESGLGIHHAGMLRADRTLSERMFESGVLRVLCCTSTLAWGVNLPAYAVLIKGTEVYDSSLGKFVDLSILDVLQIFGRAGRPQYENLGVGYICTPQEKLSHYIDAITSQHPIESNFDKGLVDSLNAECALGTVQNVQDGIAWLSYTYLFTRMRRNPMAYGMSHDEVVDDPHLGAKRLSLITGAAKRLVLCKMMEFDEGSGKMVITDLGRIAARYYIPWRTIEIFNEKLRAKMTEADVLNVLSQATDFEQIIPRDTEAKELKKMLDAAPCEVPEGFDTPSGKVNTLLQAYISRTFVEDFALASDTAYVSQNTGRIIRALFEMSLSNKWSSTTSALINMSKAVEKRMWPFDHPLMQSSLKQDTLHLVQRWADEVEVADLAEMSGDEIATLIRANEKIGLAVKSAAKQFPRLKLEYQLRPTTHDQLRIDITVGKSFEWNDRLHGGMQAFYIWVEGQDGKEIQQWSRVLIRGTTDRTTLCFTCSVSSPLPSGVTLKWISDTWIGSEDAIWCGFEQLKMPPAPPPHLPLLELPLLPTSSILSHLSADIREVYASRFLAFNALQTQALHTVLHTRSNVLLAGPVSSGKSTLAELSIWRALNQVPSTRVLVIQPNAKVLLQQQARFAASLPHVRSRVAGNWGELARSDRSMREEVVFALPQHVLQVLTQVPHALNVFKLVIAEDVHLLNAGYELALGRLKKLHSEYEAGEDDDDGPRLVVTSASLHDATSLCTWLGIKDLGCYSFHAKDRPNPVKISIQSLDLPHTVALLKTMIKPVYEKALNTVRSKPKSGPVLIFVPSRMQCTSTASDLVTRSASELDSEGFLGVPLDQMESQVALLRDHSLGEALLHGIGVFHDGMHPGDRKLIMDLYTSGAAQVLVAARESCWSLSTEQTKASLVVIMSAQYISISNRHQVGNDGELTEVSERSIQNYTTTDLLRMSSHCAHGECFVLCQVDQVDSIREALLEGVPLESRLVEEGVDENTLLVTILRQVAQGSLSDLQDVSDWLSWTYFMHRMNVNPCYYSGGIFGHLSEQVSSVTDTLIKLLSSTQLVSTTPAQVDRPSTISITALGRELVEMKNDDNLLYALLDLHKEGHPDPKLAYALCSSFSEESSTEEAVLSLLRDTIPSGWLSAFSIAKSNRQAKKARQEGAEGVQEEAVNVDRLLLCAWFAGVKIREELHNRLVGLLKSLLA